VRHCGSLQTASLCKLYVSTDRCGICSDFCCWRQQFLAGWGEGGEFGLGGHRLHQQSSNRREPAAVLTAAAAMAAAAAAVAGAIGLLQGLSLEGLRIWSASTVC
jgi:hypothetical protein